MQISKINGYNSNRNKRENIAFSSFSLKDESRIAQKMVDTIRELGKKLDGPSNKIKIILKDIDTCGSGGHPISVRRASLDAVIDGVPVNKTFSESAAYQQDKVQDSFIDYLKKLIKSIDPNFRKAAQEEIKVNEPLLENYEKEYIELKKRMDIIIKNKKTAKEILVFDKDVLKLYTPKEEYNKIKKAELLEQKTIMAENLKKINNEIKIL